MSDKPTYFYTLTNFSDPDQVAVPIVLANAALATGAEAMLWTTLEGVKLAIKNSVKDMISPSFSSIDDLFKEFTNAGGRIGVCPACAQTHGVTQENIVENGEWMGAAAVQDAIHKRNIMTF